MDYVSIIVVVGTFILMIAKAVSDNKKEKVQRHRRVSGQPVGTEEPWPSDDTEEQGEDPDTVHDVKLDSAPARQGSARQAADQVEEGQCAIQHHKAAVAEKPKKKLDIDPRKLVIYSEIMHPKFDD